MPAERSTLSQGVQIGPEAIPGTAVATTRILSSLSIEPSMKMDIKSFRPMGAKFPTITALSKEWTEAGLSGQAAYTELHYPFASVITSGTPVAGGTSGTAFPGTAFTWQFSPRKRGADNPQTFTVEQGTDEQAQRFNYGIVTEFGLKYSRDGIEVSGSMMGRKLDIGEDDTPVVMGTAAVELDLVPVLITQTAVFMGTSPTSFVAATKLDRVISYEWNLGSRFGPVWTIDSEQESWVAIVETEPSLEIKLLMQARGTGLQPVRLARKGETRYLRIESVGGTIPNTNLPYLLRIDTAVKFTDVGDFSDEDGVYAIEYTGTGIAAAPWGGTTTLVTLRNDQATF